MGREPLKTHPDRVADKNLLILVIGEVNMMARRFFTFNRLSDSKMIQQETLYTPNKR